MVNNYTVKVTNRFRGLDLLDRVPEELWTEVRDIVQKVVIKTIPKEKECKKAKRYDTERQTPQVGRMISVHFQGKPFNITVIQVYAPTSNA